MPLINVNASLTPHLLAAAPISLISPGGTLQTHCVAKCMNECICCSNLVRNILPGQRTMFNYGSREIIKLVIQALHQRLSERSRGFNLRPHVKRRKYWEKIELNYFFAFVFLKLSSTFPEHSPLSQAVLGIYNLTQPHVPSLLLLSVGVWLSC